MRVSTFGSFLTGVTAMQRLQSALDTTQRQISSGRKILVPSDDPIGAGRALEMRETISRLDQFDRNAGIAENRLAVEESALASTNNVLQRVRELTLQASNATQSNETRGLIAVELRQQLDQLVQIANQRDGNGRYLFSGNQGDVEPVSRTGSTYTYNGDQGQRELQVGEGRRVADSDPGSDVFFKIRAGNGDFRVAAAATNTGVGLLGQGSVVDPALWDQDTYTIRFVDPANYEVLDSAAAVVSTGAFAPGDQIAFRGVEFKLSGQPAAADEFTLEPSPYVDVFSVVDRLATALETNVSGDPAQAAQLNEVNASLLDIDQSIGVLLEVRTKVGARLAAIENQVDANGAQKLTLQETLGSIEDLDYAEALSRLSIEITTLEAAQQSFVRTQRLSLFNLL